MYSRIEATLRHLGHDVSRTRSGIDSGDADLALCDVESGRPRTRRSSCSVRRAILGYGSHDAPQALRRARQVGFDRVVARSAIAERLPELVDELLATAPSHDPSSSGATPR